MCFEYMLVFVHAGRITRCSRLKYEEGFLLKPKALHKKTNSEAKRGSGNTSLPGSTLKMMQMLKIGITSIKGNQTFCGTDTDVPAENEVLPGATNIIFTQPRGSSEKNRSK